MQDANITQEESEESKETLEELGEETETPDETEEETGTPEETQPEKAEKSKELQSALAQKDHYRKKYSDALAKMEKLKKSDSVSSDMPIPTNPMEVVRLAKSLEGYSESEVDFIIRNAPDKSIDSVINTTNDDWVKTAISAKREKVEKEKKTPDPSSPSSVLNGKTGEDLEKMDDKEFSKWAKENMSSGRGRTGI